MNVGAVGSGVFAQALAVLDDPLGAPSTAVLGVSFVGDIDFGFGSTSSAGGQDGFVARYDGDGSPGWVVTVGDAADQMVTALAAGGEGAARIVVGGAYQGTVDLGLGPLPSPAAGQTDLFIGAFDELGTVVWSKRLAVNGTAGLASAAVAADGTVVVVGDLQGQLDVEGAETLDSDGLAGFALRLDAQGGVSWTRVYRSTGIMRVRDVAVDPVSGDIFIAGGVVGPVDFGGGYFETDGVDAFALRVDVDGGHVWSRAFSGDGNEGAQLALDGAGHVLLAGDFAGAIQLGDVLLESGGGREMFALQLETD